MTRIKHSLNYYLTISSIRRRLSILGSKDTSKVRPMPNLNNIVS